MLVPISFLGWIFLNVAKALDLADRPRFELDVKDGFFRKCSLGGYHSRVELLQGPSKSTIYAGCSSKLVFINFQDSCNSMQVPLNYSVTLLHRYANGQNLIVCGTNGRPVCYNMSLEMVQSNSQPISAKGIAPVAVDERAPSVFIRDELYTAASVDGSVIGIRRNFGPIGSLWSSPNKTEQRYVALAWSGPREDRLQDRVYTFLLERNSDSSLKADLWVPQVAQICRMDRGGPKNRLQKSWTSHLKAQMICGFPDRRLYFSELRDVAVLHMERWMDSRVYALFSNGWNMSAVCVYTMGDINHVFTKSDFKGKQQPVPEPRPGTCVEESRSLPQDVLTMMMNQVEMVDWVKPLGDRPLMVSSHHYTHVQVDSVTGTDRKQYTVLFLSLADGSIHKVVEVMGQPFIIAVLRPFQHNTIILNMLLSSTKKLYVSTSTDVVEVDLHTCQSYGSQCIDCIQARDPYCAWDYHSMSCQPTSSGTIQDVEQGRFHFCKGADAAVQAAVHSTHSMLELPQSASHFLQCPMRSGHARYSWYHNGVSQECVYTEHDCLLLIKHMSPADDGIYQCRASEGGHEKTVTEALLKTWDGAAGLTSSLTGLVYLLLYSTLLL